MADSDLFRWPEAISFDFSTDCLLPHTRARAMGIQGNDGD